MNSGLFYTIYILTKINFRFRSFRAVHIRKLVKLLWAQVRCVNLDFFIQFLRRVSVRAKGLYASFQGTDTSPINQTNNSGGLFYTQFTYKSQTKISVSFSGFSDTCYVLFRQLSHLLFPNGYRNSIGILEEYRKYLLFFDSGTISLIPIL